jgi:hypothetical protein
LVMRSIDLDVERAVLICVARNGRKLSDFAAGLDSRRMDGIRRVRREAFFAVLNLSLQLAGYVLVERATVANVKTLAAIANGENRFSGGKSVLEDSEIGFFAVRVSVVRLFMARGAVKRRIHIGGSAGEDEGVQIVDLCGEFVWRKLERHVDGLGLGCGDGGEVILKLVRDGVGLFMRSAPGDAHTGARATVQLEVSRGHGTPNRSIRRGGRQPGQSLCGARQHCGRCRPAFLKLTDKPDPRLGWKGGGMSEGGVEAEVGPMEEGGEFGEAEGEAFRGGGAERNVAEFAAWPRGFAVEM